MKVRMLLNREVGLRSMAGVIDESTSAVQNLTSTTTATETTSHGHHPRATVGWVDAVLMRKLAARQTRKGSRHSGRRSWDVAHHPRHHRASANSARILYRDSG